MSSWRLLREPDERNERIGGMTGRPGDEAERIGLYDTGGRDVDVRRSVGLSWRLSPLTAAGDMRARCPWAHFFVVVSGVCTPCE